MALIMKYIDSMHRYMESYGDPRTKDWPLMSSPFPTLAVCLTYVYIVKVLGPRLMENRKPFHLKNTLIVYNFLQVIFSAWLFYECLMGGWWGEYSFRCQPVDYSDNPTATRMVHACWWYYFSKFTEFMDTIFFVLRKKTSQVSTLHVIHHGCMPMSVWFGVKFTPGGHSTFFGLLNTFVHIVMYTYYLFAAMGPQYQKYLWWKKYLTALQMVQFVLIMVHAFQLLFIDCNYPRAFVWWIGMHAVMFFFLFNEFYKSTYKANQTKINNWISNFTRSCMKHGVNNRNNNSNGAIKAQQSNGHCNGTILKTKQTIFDESSTSEQSSSTNNVLNQRHLQNGSATKCHHPYENGSATNNAADYYVNGELPSQLIQRKIQK